MGSKSIVSNLLAVSIILLFSFETFADTGTLKGIKTTQKGYYEVYCDEEYISRHNTYHKALEVSSNKGFIGANVCLINPPKIEVSFTREAVVTDPDDPVVTERGVKYTWEIPTEREDGTPLPVSEINSYVIYTGSDPELTQIVTRTIVDPTATNIEITLPLGTYYSAISTVDSDGVEGRKSPTITTIVL